MKNNNVVKAGIWYTIANFFTQGITFLLMPIFTRIMSVSDIGDFSNITSWFSILSIITSFELLSSVTVARFDYKKDFNQYISSILLLGTVITTIFYIIFLTFSSFFVELFAIDFFTMNVIFIYLLFYPAIQIFQKINQYEYKYKKSVAVTLGSCISSSFFSILLTILMKNSLKGRVIGYYFPFIFTSIIIYIYLIKRGKSFSKKYWKYALSISIPLIFHLLAGNLLASSDKIMITKMLGKEHNAYYSVAYTISLIVSVLWSSINTAWSPWAFEKMENKEYSSLKSNSKYCFIFFWLIVVFFMLITPELLLLMGGKKYYDAKSVMPPVMVGYIFQCIYSFYVNIEFYNKKQKYIAFGTIVAAIANILLNYILLPIYGYIAAAYTTLIGYILLFIIHYFLVRRIKCNSWYDNKFFAGMGVLSIIFLFIVLIMYYVSIIYRYAFIIGILIIIFYIIFKKKHIFMFKLGVGKNDLEN